MESPNTVPAAGAQTINLALAQGWNLISLPIEPINPAVEAVMMDVSRGTVITGMVWRNIIDGTGTFRYEAITEMHALLGYWIYVPSAVTIPITGTPLDASQTLAMQQGWNLIGSTAEIAISPNTSLAGPLWWWDATARQYKSVDPVSDMLIPGKGYWLFATQPVDLVLGQ